MAGQPVKRGTMAHEHDVYTLLADTAAWQRDLDGLRVLGPQAESLATRDDHKLHRPILWRASGVEHRLEGRLGEAEVLFERALKAFEQMDGSDWQTARTLTELAELALDCAEKDLARAYYARALPIFETMRAAPDADRVRAALARLDA